MAREAIAGVVRLAGGPTPTRWLALRCPSLEEGKFFSD